MVPPIQKKRSGSHLKRSEINALVRAATQCFQSHGWALPPDPKWDVTDFGLADWRQFGLVLVNLAEEPEYCEKLMYVQAGMTAPAHCHHNKKEDIISRWGVLSVQVWPTVPGKAKSEDFTVPVNGKPKKVKAGDVVEIPAGSRITLVPGVYHEFKSKTPECIIGEVSTANDDLHDNIFVNPDIGRFPGVEEDEPRFVRLVSDLAI
jgi:D-lyxose ketol-isomerase